MSQKALPITHIWKRNESALSMAVDHQTRTIFLFGGIDDDAAYRFAVAMHILDADRNQPITVQLNSPGGVIEAGYAIYDTIKLAKNFVQIVGSGSVMSMAAIIMQAGDLRLMTPNARMMIHTGSVGFDGGLDSDKFISIGDEMKGVREHFIDILAERTELSRAKIEQMVLKETYLSAEEAKKLGFIDGMVTPSPGSKDVTKLDAPKKRVRK